MDEWIWMSASSQAKAIRDRDVSSEELVTAHLNRIQEVNPRLNAVVQVVSDRALAEAREADRMCARGEMKGPLHGVPMTLKDSLDTEGLFLRVGLQDAPPLCPNRMLWWSPVCGLPVGF